MVVVKPSQTLSELDGALNVKGTATVVGAAFGDTRLKLPVVVAAESVAVPVNEVLKVTGTVTFTCVLPETETGGVVPNAATFVGETCGAMFKDPVNPLGLMPSTKWPCVP